MLQKVVPLEFSHSEYLLPAILVVVTTLLSALWFAYRRERILRRFGTYQYGRVYGSGRIFLYGMLVSASVTVIALLLLGPHLVIREHVPEYEPLDIVIALDASPSMLAQATEHECGPSRLQMAKAQVNHFLDHLDRTRIDRVGLVVFTRIGYRLIPLLTKDYDLVRTVQGEFSDTEIARGGLLSGTNHWDALAESTKVFSRRSTNARVLIIITDGEPDAPESVLTESRRDALRRVSQLGDINVSLIGIGDPVARYPIPLSRGADGCPLGYLVQTEGPDSGSLIMTTMDQAQLRSLAKELGGAYRHARRDADLLTAMRGIVDAERQLIGTRSIRAEQDISHQLLYLLLVLLLLVVAVKSP